MDPSVPITQFIQILSTEFPYLDQAKYTKLLLDNEFNTVSDLVQLTDEEWKELIPALGTRNKFKTKVYGLPACSSSNSTIQALAQAYLQFQQVPPQQQQQKEKRICTHSDQDSAQEDEEEPRSTLSSSLPASPSSSSTTTPLPLSPPESSPPSPGSSTQSSAPSPRIKTSSTTSSAPASPRSISTKKSANSSTTRTSIPPSPRSKLTSPVVKSTAQPSTPSSLPSSSLSSQSPSVLPSLSSQSSSVLPSLSSQSTLPLRLYEPESTPTKPLVASSSSPTIYNSPLLPLSPSVSPSVSSPLSSQLSPLLQSLLSPSLSSQSSSVLPSLSSQSLVQSPISPSSGGRLRISSLGAKSVTTPELPASSSHNTRAKQVSLISETSKSPTNSLKNSHRAKSESNIKSKALSTPTIKNQQRKSTGKTKKEIGHKYRNSETSSGNYGIISFDSVKVGGPPAPSYVPQPPPESVDIDNYSMASSESTSHGAIRNRKRKSDKSAGNSNVNPARVIEREKTNESIISISQVVNDSNLREEFANHLKENFAENLLVIYEKINSYFNTTWTDQKAELNAVKEIFSYFGIGGKSSFTLDERILHYAREDFAKDIVPKRSLDRAMDDLEDILTTHYVDFLKKKPTDTKSDKKLRKFSTGKKSFDAKSAVKKEDSQSSKLSGVGNNNGALQDEKFSVETTTTTTQPKKPKESKSDRIPENEEKFMSPQELHRTLEKMTDRCDGFPIKDRKHAMKVIQQCFTGAEAVTWLQVHFPSWDRARATRFCQSLMEDDFIGNAISGGKKKFYDSESAFYNFPKSPLYSQSADKGKLTTFSNSSIYKQIPSSPNDTRITTLLTKAKNRQTGFDVKDRTYHLKKFKNCFVASESITWLVDELKLKNRVEAVLWGRKLQELDLIRSAGHNCIFDDKHIFFRWAEDDITTTDEIKHEII